MVFGILYFTFSISRLACTKLVLYQVPKYQEKALKNVKKTYFEKTAEDDSKEDDNKAKKQSSKSKDATSKVRFLYLVTSGTYML